MNKIQKTAIVTVVAGVLLSLTACADMSRRDRNTVVGAGVGAGVGAVLTGGSAAGVVGGAAVGGVIGHEVDKRD